MHGSESPVVLWDTHVEGLLKTEPYPTYRPPSTLNPKPLKRGRLRPGFGQ